MPKGGDSSIGHGGDVGSGRIGAGLKGAGADAEESVLHRAERFYGGSCGLRVEAERMRGSRIALNGGDAVREVIGIFRGVSSAAGAAGLFVHPGNDAQGASRAQVKALQDFGGLHGDDNAGSIVDGSSAEIPGIEMPGDDYDLLGVLGAFEICDNVVTGFVGELLRGKCEMQAHFSLGREVDD